LVSSIAASSAGGVKPEDVPPAAGSVGWAGVPYPEELGVVVAGGAPYPDDGAGPDTGEGAGNGA